MQYDQGINWSLMRMRFRRAEKEMSEKWKTHVSKCECECDGDEKLEVFEWWHEFTLYKQQHGAVSTKYLCGCMSPLSNMAWWCFTITQLLASYKVCMLFYYPLHNDVPLHDVVHNSRKPFYLSRCSVLGAVCAELFCCSSHLQLQLWIYPSSSVYVQNKIQYNANILCGNSYRIVLNS